MEPWLGIEGSNLGFLSQSQASYHWTNPQGQQAYCNAGPCAGQDPAGGTRQLTSVNLSLRDLGRHRMPAKRRMI